MRLILSSEAAPDLPLRALAETAAARGFAGLELVAGHAHGVEAGLSTPGSALPVAAIRVASLADACSPAMVRLAADLSAPLVAPAGELPHGTVESFRAASSRLLLAHGSDPEEVKALRGVVDQAPDVLGLAWDADPAADDLASRTQGVLTTAGPALRLVRLRGGGPEAAAQSGQGVGALMGRLALARYTGPIVIAPSTPRFRPAWSMWLGRPRGWGCGSKVAERDLVVL